MKVRFLGHSCFLITSDAGTRIITDPYHTGKEFNLSEIKESADIVTVSHEHPDHNNIAAVQGNPRAVKAPAKVKGIEFKAINSYHDKVKGKEMGSNLILVFEVDGVKLCHLGDLGHPLNESQLTTLGKVDILLLPVGGGYTIDATVATEVCNQVNPRVIIPMHYKTAGLRFLADVEDFLRGNENVTQVAMIEMEFSQDKLSVNTQIIVLTPALLTC